MLVHFPQFFKGKAMTLCLAKHIPGLGQRMFRTCSEIHGTSSEVFRCLRIWLGLVQKLWPSLDKNLLPKTDREIVPRYSIMLNC